MATEINEKIERRRKDLGLSQDYAATKIGVTVMSYFDLEAYSDEIFTVTELSKIKSLLQLLSLDFFELFEIQCAFCDQKKSFLKDYLLPRNELVEKRRIAKRFSKEELGDRLGFYEIAIIEMEKDSNFLEEWVLENIMNLSNELDIPLQILLGIKCNKCNR